jgi:hypothetical protein
MSMSMYRRNVERISKQKADLEKKESQEHEKIAKLQHEIATIQRSITRSTSPSTLRSKQRQIESKQKALVQSRKKAAELAAKIASKQTELNRNVQNLERAEGQERKKQATKAKQQRGEELRHARELTRETQKQAYLHSEMSRSPLIIDLSKLPTKITVLFLAANPRDQTQLRLDEEIRAITEKLRASEYRESVELISVWAIRPPDLLQALNEHKPHIVHFSGHGSSADELLFLDSEGNAKPVSKEAIMATMNTLADNIRVVVFNSCFSTGQAEAVTQYVDVAIGMNADIGDEAARVFSAQFYSAIGFGRSVGEAFDQAITALMLEDIPEDKTPEIFTREGIDANEVTLVRPIELE